MSIPVYDSVTPAASGTSTGATVTVAKATAGSNRLTFAVSFHTGGGGLVCTGVTCDGVAMDPVASEVDPGTFQVRLWKILAPPTASVNYVGSFTGAGGTRVLLVASYNNVHQTTPLGTPVTNSGTSTTPNTGNFTSAIDELAIGVYETGNANGRTTDGNDRVDSGPFPPLAVLFDKTGAATSSFNWTQTNSSTWGAIGVSLKGVGAGEGPPPASADTHGLAVSDAVGGLFVRVSSGELVE